MGIHEHLDARDSTVTECDLGHHVPGDGRLDEKRGGFTLCVVESFACNGDVERDAGFVLDNFMLILVVVARNDLIDASAFREERSEWLPRRSIVRPETTGRQTTLLPSSRTEWRRALASFANGMELLSDLRLDGLSGLGAGVFKSILLRADRGCGRSREGIMRLSVDPAASPCQRRGCVVDPG